MSLEMLREKIKVVDDASTVKILLVEESDFKANETISGINLAELNDVYGDISDNSLYLCDMASKTYIFKFNIDKIKKSQKLDSYTPGKTHIEMTAGGMLTGHLIVEKYFKIEDVVSFEASENLKNKLTFGAHFIAGMRLKSVSNKMRFKTSENQNDDPKKGDKRLINFSSICDEHAIQGAENLIESLIISKTLVNTPANILNPESYEKFALDYVTELKERGFPVDVEVYDRSKLQNDGAGLILAVGGASQYPPRIIKMTYTPEDAGKHICLVGKGITYDTGGLNLKPGSAMRNMKKDMGGSAAVFGSFALAVLSKRSSKITAYLAVAENMVSSNSARPGDVYVARNGLSVEIDNTDAEGRLVLADALTYASDDQPDLLVDIATLTGAARVALGTQVDLCLSNNPEFAEPIMKASIETGDWVWRQPRVETYYSSLDSKVAKMENTGSRFGGALTAGMFLERFHKNKNWIHLDTWMWSDKPNVFAKEAGATPKTVCFLNEFLNSIEGV